MENLIFGFTTAFISAYLLLPPVINLANEKHLCDVPGERSSHFVPTPSLGGIAIFFSILLTLLFWLPESKGLDSRYHIGALLLIFILGIKDDLSPLPARVKLLGQIAVGIIITVLTEVRIQSMHGLFLLEGNMPYWLSIAVSVFTIVVIINAFNLIDGINGLSACIGILAGLTLSFWFFWTDQPAYALIAITLAGAYSAFLPYNLMPPTRTFMGDGGSLVLGTMVAILSIQFIESNDALPPTHPFQLDGIAVVAMAVVTVPLFDTLRVFATRMFRGSSPFKPDRRHLHHLLIDYGYSHGEATARLLLFNAAIIVFVFSCQYYLEQHLLLLIVLAAAGLLTLYYHRAVNKKRTPYQAHRHYTVDAPSSQENGHYHPHSTPNSVRKKVEGQVSRS
jgi:UDP-N-acetylmuramyl pentapeptide phosphotransferase/UDP-N-acetylglucosamine-1-phosphate transferase